MGLGKPVDGYIERAEEGGEKHNVFVDCVFAL